MEADLPGLPKSNNDHIPEAKTCQSVGYEVGKNVGRGKFELIRELIMILLKQVITL